MQSSHLLDNIKQMHSLVIHQRSAKAQSVNDAHTPELIYEVTFLEREGKSRKC